MMRIPSGVLVTVLRRVPSHEHTVVQSIGVTVGNHDGLYRSPAQMATMKRRLIIKASSLGADTVVKVVLSDVSDPLNSGPPTLNTQGLCTIRQVDVDAAYAAVSG